MRPSSWNGVGAIAKVPAAWAVSFVIECLCPFVMPGWSEGPDLRCAIAQRGISRFRVRATRAPERLLLKSPRRLLDILFGEEDVLGVGHDILGLPPRKRRRPAFHFHHPHFPHPARAGNAEHLAGLVARQVADHV